MDVKIKAAFGTIWPSHVSSLTKFLIACRKAFCGDIDMFLVLTIIGDRTFSQRHADPSLDYEAFRSGVAHRTTSLEINLRSIADYSGIPRETVRRKINQLVELGWVSRQPDGSLVATSKARESLEPLTIASIQYLSGMLQMFTDTFDGTAYEKQPEKPRKKTDQSRPSKGRKTK